MGLAIPSLALATALYCLILALTVHPTLSLLVCHTILHSTLPLYSYLYQYLYFCLCTYLCHVVLWMHSLSQQRKRYLHLARWWMRHFRITLYLSRLDRTWQVSLLHKCGGLPTPTLGLATLHATKVVGDTPISPQYTNTHSAPTLRLLICPTLLHCTCYALWLWCYALLFIPIPILILVLMLTFVVCWYMLHHTSYCILFHNSGSSILISCKMVDKAFSYYPQFLKL